MRHGPITEDRGKLGVKLGECGAQSDLAGRVGTASEVAGDGKRGMRKETSEAEPIHRLAIRLLSPFAFIPSPKRDA
jgi:hypothetical protein